MSYPPPSSGWPDPTRPQDPWSNDNNEQADPGQQFRPPTDPAAPASGQPGPAQAAGDAPYPQPGPYGAMPTTAYPGPYATSGYPQPAYPGYGYPPRKTNSLAIAALVLSLAGVATCITAPVGAILGHVARKQIRENGEDGEGMAKAGIIIGWILTGLLVLATALYVAVIAYVVVSSEPGSTI